MQTYNLPIDDNLVHFLKNPLDVKKVKIIRPNKVSHLTLLNPLSQTSNINRTY